MSHTASTVPIDKIIVWCVRMSHLATILKKMAKSTTENLQGFLVYGNNIGQ
jgi:hypothetical protein